MREKDGLASVDLAAAGGEQAKDEEEEIDQIQVELNCSGRVR